MKYSFLILFLFVFACLPVRVVDVGKLSSTANGRNYKTYNFGGIDMKSQPFGNYQKNLQFITVAIDREMQAKGFTRGVADPDLMINIGLAINEVVQTRETNFQTDRNQYQYSGRNYSWKSQEVEVARYKEGHLALDFVDREKNEMIWQGSVAGTLVKDDRKMEERINTVMKDLFKKFPLKAN